MPPLVFDYSFCFVHHIRIYKLFGFWKPDKNMKWKSLYNLYTITCIVVWILFLLSQAFYMYVNRANIDEVTATLFVTVTFLVDLIKMITIYNNIDFLKDFINNLNSPLYEIKTQEQYVIAEGAKNLCHRYFYLCLYCGVQTDIFFTAVPFLVDERISPAKGWFPYDWTVSPNYELTYIFQTAVMVWNTLLCLNLDSFYASLAIQVGLQCDLLCNILENLDNFFVQNGLLSERSTKQKILLKKDNKLFSREMNKNLIVCVNHHKTILEIAERIGDIHYKSLFILFIGGGFILCSCLFQLSTTKIGTLEFFYLLFYLMSMLLEQFTYCWFGNEVKLKSGLILNSAFLTPWPECDIEFRKNLIFFMTRVQKPISMRAGGLLEVSTNTFISVLRTSYSYFTVLKQME